MPILLLVASLLIVALGRATGRSLAARVAALVGRESRPRMIAGWAIGTATAYGLTAIVALALLGRAGDVVAMPPELVVAAWALDLPAQADATTLLWLGGSMVVGIVLGCAALIWRRWQGKGPIGMPYRSPATARARDERIPATLLAVSAGIAEEVFFRLLLPLLVALVFGSGLAGFAVALVAFTLLHRHQGWIGMAAVGLVGAWLTYLYLLTGALWVAMLLHTLIDLHALVLRPWLFPDPARD